MALPCPRRRPARTESLWAVGGFVALSLGFVVAAEVRFPEWYDPEYAARKDLLGERLAEAPDRPLLAVLGSSRAGTGICAECLPPLTDADGQRVLVFNYSHPGAGPRLNLVQLRRLLRDGARPRWVVIELLPAHLHGERTPASLVSAADARALLPYVNGPNFVAEYARTRLNAPYRYRTPFLWRVAPALATQSGTADDVSVGPLGDDLRLRRPEALTPEGRARQFRVIRGAYAEIMRTFRIDPALAAAARDLLAACRDHGIEAVVLIGPEDSRFRSWYGPGVGEAIHAFYARLGGGFGVPVVDARGWSPDEDFIDPHHLTPDGARRFTLRLEREVLKPLVHGQLRLAK